MVDSFELLCGLTTEERINQDTIHRLSFAKMCRALTTEEKNELKESIAQQTENEIIYRKVSIAELEI
jgi:hypothetical protein